ncbi:MAG: electron transfer flavoprotein subunit beta/FixA family protein [Sphingobacteriales bacterium]|nr:electron transfer flavoprotein subunit beta/FixA family protein [Sphingobacteriales bacterium]
MKILVCISKVPDTTTKISFTNNNTQFNESGVTSIINPTDEWYALVRALELVEQNGGSVTVACVGDATAEQLIRKALAIGGDEGVRIDVEPQDAYQAAANLAAYAKDKNFDIIFTGKETINYNGSIMGGMLAELLDLPYISLASKLDIQSNIATIEREIEGGREIVEVAIPFVASANKGLAEQRIPNMRGIMAARTKPVQVIAPYSNTDALTQVVGYELPAARSSVQLIAPDNMDELVRLLHEKSKVI